MHNHVATAPHSPGKFRVLGILSNVDKFYKKFKVKKEDAMYIAPEKHVKI
jgi:endothelin-converting enzyme/putative endopeptidase